jgi:hypothetical protein
LFPRSKGFNADSLIAGEAFAHTGIQSTIHYPFIRSLGYKADLCDMNSMAANREGYPPTCSCTMRTARSWISEKKVVDFLMAPSSQMQEPPQNRGGSIFDLCFKVKR